MKSSALIALASIAIAVAACIVIVAVTINRPLGADVTADPDHFCPQSEDFTCADAAMVMAESWQGKSVTERQMVVDLGTTRAGTSTAAIAKFAGALAQPLPQSAPGRTFVVVMPADPFPKDHAICAHGDATGWWVGDPELTGPERWTAQDFSSAICAVEVKP